MSGSLRIGLEMFRISTARGGSLRGKGRGSAAGQQRSQLLLNPLSPYTQGTAPVGTSHSLESHSEDVQAAQPHSPGCSAGTPNVQAVVKMAEKCAVQTRRVGMAPVAKSPPGQNRAVLTFLGDLRRLYRRMSNAQGQGGMPGKPSTFARFLLPPGEEV